MEKKTESTKINKHHQVSRPLRSWLITGLSLLVTGTSCNYSREKTNIEKKPERLTTQIGLGDSGGVDLYQELQSQLFKPFCVSCHNSSQTSGGVNLETFEALVKSQGSRTKSPILVPGKPQDSSLFMTIVTGQMPPGPKKPGKELIASLAKWIEDGAFREPPKTKPDVQERPEAPQELPPVAPTQPQPPEVLPLPQPPEVTPQPQPPVAPTQPQPPPALEPQPQPSPAILFSQIQKKVIDEHCIFCHEGAYASGGVLLDSFDALTSPSSTGLISLVKPGDLTNSLLYQSLIRTTDRMPPGDDPLPQDLVDLVKNWIEKGALQ